MWTPIPLRTLKPVNKLSPVEIKMKNKDSAEPGLFCWTSNPWILNPYLLSTLMWTSVALNRPDAMTQSGLQVAAERSCLFTTCCFCLQLTESTLFIRTWICDAAGVLMFESKETESCRFMFGLEPATMGSDPQQELETQTKLKGTSRTEDLTQDWL